MGPRALCQIVMQCFYPSRAVNYAEHLPEYRALLIYGFLAAFAELDGRFRLPEFME
jgi:hypothetical protein